MTTQNSIAVADTISKRFYATQALEDVSLKFNAGEVHALIGENGAGKSTLMKIFGGIHQPDKGRIIINGREVKFSSPGEAASGRCYRYPSGTAGRCISISCRKCASRSIARKIHYGFLTRHRPKSDGLSERVSYCKNFISILIRTWRWSD